MLSPILNGWLNFISSSFLLFQKVTCWLQWHMTTMLPSATPCFTMSLCLIISAYKFWGITGSTIHAGFMLRLLFCKNNVVNHYFCDLFPLLELSCSSIYVNELLVILLSAFNILISALVILLPTSSSSPASSKSTPRRAGPKPSAPVALTSQLLLFSMDILHSCTWSHDQSALQTKGKFPLCFTSSLCPC